MTKLAVFVPLNGRLDINEIIKWIETNSEYFCWNEGYTHTPNLNRRYYSPPNGVYLNKEDATALILKFDIRGRLR